MINTIFENGEEGVVGRMNKTIVVAIGIAVTGLLIGYFIQSNKPVGKSSKSPELFLSEREQRAFYALDKGLDFTEEPNLTRDGEALRLLKEKLIWIVSNHNIRKDKTAANVILQKLGRVKGDFEIIGWRAKGVDEQTSLVSYTYKKDGKILGWFYDVKSGGRIIIRDVSLDDELMKKYNVVNKAVFTEEDEAELAALMKELVALRKRNDELNKPGRFKSVLLPSEIEKPERVINLQVRRAEHNEGILMLKQE